MLAAKEVTSSRSIFGNVLDEPWGRFRLRFLLSGAIAGGGRMPGVLMISRLNRRGRFLGIDYGVVVEGKLDFLGMGSALVPDGNLALEACQGMADSGYSDLEGQFVPRLADSAAFDAIAGGKENSGRINLGGEGGGFTLKQEENAKLPQGLDHNRGRKDGVLLKMPLEEILVARDPIGSGSLVAVNLDGFEKKEGLAMGHQGCDFLDPVGLGPSWRFLAPRLSGKIGLYVPNSPQVPQFLVVDADLQSLLNQHDDFKHGKGVHPQVLVHAHVIVAVGENLALLGLEMTVDNPHDDGLDLADVLVLTESQGCLISTRWTALQKIL